MTIQQAQRKADQIILKAETKLALKYAKQDRQSVRNLEDYRAYTIVQNAKKAVKAAKAAAKSRR